MTGGHFNAAIYENTSSQVTLFNLFIPCLCKPCGAHFFNYVPIPTCSFYLQ